LLLWQWFGSHLCWGFANGAKCVRDCVVADCVCAAVDQTNPNDLVCEDLGSAVYILGNTISDYKGNPKFLPSVSTLLKEAGEIWKGVGNKDRFSLGLRTLALDVLADRLFGWAGR
jgi:hypothetical protein